MGQVLVRSCQAVLGLAAMGGAWIYWAQVSTGVPWAGISQLLGYSLFPRLFTPGAALSMSLLLLPASKLLCHNLPAALGAFPSHLLLNCSLLCLLQVWGWLPAPGNSWGLPVACMSCSRKTGACFHLPEVPGIAGEIVTVLLCCMWEAYSACTGLGFIFYISLVSVHIYFLVLAVAWSSRCSCPCGGVLEEQPGAVEEGCRLYYFPSVREQPYWMESDIEAEFSPCHGRAELLLLSNVQNVCLRL